MQTAKEKILKIMERLRTEEELYAVMSVCTRMPFVYCMPETYDDTVLLYFDTDDAKEGTKRFLEQKDPIQLAKIDKKDRLAFFTGLYPMGVNAITVNYGISEGLSFQLNDLVRRQSEDKLPNGQMRIENPELHLTALYFAQELKKGAAGSEETTENKEERTQALNGLNEELLAHFRKGTYLVAVTEDKKRPVLEKKGVSYQPIFTDVQEFQKFNREKIFQALAVTFENIPRTLPKETDGVVINPLGVDIVLKITHQKE